MLDAKRIAPVASGTAPLSSTMPQDLLRHACRRVAIANLIIAGLWAFALFMNEVVYRLIGTDEPWHAAWDAVGGASSWVGFGLSLATALAARRFHRRPHFVFNLGLVSEVVSAFLIAFLSWWSPVMHGGRVSWVAVLILVYPTIVPSSPRRILLASLAAATMEVLAFGIAARRGVLPADATVFNVLWSLVVPYVCAFLAVVPAKVIRNLGQQVNQARQLGSYSLGERLGSGGMGEVYRATHRMLARPAAIKLIRPEILGASTPDAARVLVQRFRREARAAASLRSPHTIELYDFGVAEDGTFFYVMEFLDGIDLESLVKRFGPLPAPRAVHLLQQICESLAEAHAAGLVHRDIKPSNTHVCRMGRRHDYVKVLDFGLVKVEHETDADATRLTAPHLVTGTPAFLAPEAATGSSDRRVDLYALGCVAYWLLTGKLVFEAETPLQMILRHVQEAPVPPSQATEMPIPAELDALVLDCLAKQPQDRPADAEVLLQRLAALPLGETWDEERARRWWSVHMPAGTALPELESGTPTAFIVHAT